ncbi:MAG: hypothetical protein IK136_04620 [Oscillospiraceae bacterium]|nr:hypothetical protein [Oscillospiraceae bacterium]
MKKKKRLFTVLGVVLGVVFVAGVTWAVAATNYGSSTDPLVTLSYLEQTVKPGIKSELDSSIEAAREELKADFDEALASAQTGGQTGVVSPDAFAPVTLSSRQVIRCTAGAEILVRSGSATAYGGVSPRLTDETDGTAVDAAGAALANDHMYLVPADGNGLRAASDSVTLLVRGGYAVYSNL